MFEYILTAIILAVVILIYVLYQNKSERYIPPNKKELKDSFDWDDFTHFDEKK
jgi:uncharacterized membrane protein